MNELDRTEQGDARPSRRHRLPVVFAAVIVVLAIVWLGLRAAGRTALPTASASTVATRTVAAPPARTGRRKITFAYSCGGIITAGPNGLVGPPSVPPPTANPCAIAWRDFARRTSLDDSQRERDAAIGSQVTRALAPLRIGFSPAPCPTTNPAAAGSCGLVPAPPTQSDVAMVRQALTAAGFHDVTVRLARPDDPAPTGALQYAVGNGPVCVVGHLGAVGEESQIVEGRLQDGTCLSP